MVRLSEVKDVVVSPRGVERPIIHIVAVNNNLINIAYELESIILLGVPHDDTDYRPFNVDVRVARFLMGKETKGVQSFNRARARMSKALKPGSRISNIAHQGVDYLLIYYFLSKHKPTNIEETNNFEHVVEAFSEIDSMLAPLKLTAVELKQFAEFVLTYHNLLHPLGSRVQSITRLQILNSADLAHPTWRSLYIYRIIRNIPLSVRRHFLRPDLDWAFVRCTMKHFFSSQELKSQAKLGDNIDFLAVTAARQLRAIDDIVADASVADVRKLAASLKEAISKIDYTLGDLALVTFFEDIGSSFYDEVTLALTSSTQTLATSILTDHEQLKHAMLQYLYALFLLTRTGIIHNGARLQNILLTPLDPSEQKKKRVYELSKGKFIEMSAPVANLTLINVDDAILSHSHHDFSQSALRIEQEMVIALKAGDKKMVRDYDIAFTCYAMYDVVKFCLLLRMQLDSIDREYRRKARTMAMHKRNREWLDSVIQNATDILGRLFATEKELPFEPKVPHGSIEWLIETIYPCKTNPNAESEPLVQTPEYISSRRKHADTLKLQYIGQYASNVR